MRNYIYKGSVNSAVFNIWRNDFTVGKLYKGTPMTNRVVIQKSNQGLTKWIDLEYFNEITTIEVIVYRLLIGVKYFTGILGMVAFASALTGAYHQFYVSALAFLLYYLQTKKIL